MDALGEGEGGVGGVDGGVDAHIQQVFQAAARIRLSERGRARLFARRPLTGLERAVQKQIDQGALHAGVDGVGLVHRFVQSGGEPPLQLAVRSAEAARVVDAT